MIKFIFMLTHNDRTVDNATEVLQSLRDTGLRYVGFKDVGATPEQQKELTAIAHDQDMEVMLEVVSTSKESELDSLRAARNAGVDWVLGGTHAVDGVEVLRDSGITYCPFPGRIEGHPSALVGTVEEIAADAARLCAIEGVDGLDLLTYRNRGVDPAELTRAVVEACPGPVVAAGSVVSTEQIELLAGAGAWGFTIGSAIFDGLLPNGPDVAGQVRWVLEAAQAAGA
jgi:hypothetical protein